MIGCKPFISIVIPVYNAGECLNAGLDSILHQAFTDYEVILVNDGSTDKSLSICEEYARADRRFKLFNQNNAGVAEARNVGLRMATAEYVTFMDADDWAEPDWLQIYVDALSQVSSDMFVQGLVVDMPDSIRKEQTDGGVYCGKEVFEAFCRLEKRGIGGYVHNKMYRLSIIRKHSLHFRYLLHEDTLFNIEYVCHVSSLSVLSHASYHYVQHNGGSLVTKRYPFDYMMSLNAAIRDARLRMADVFAEEAYKDEAWSRYWGRFTVALPSMYRYPILYDRQKRLGIWKSYQAGRKKHKGCRLNFVTLPKRLFAHVALWPPVVVDSCMSMLSFFKKKFGL